MKRMKQRRVSAGRKQRRLQSLCVHLVRHGTENATEDPEHALQDELHSGPSRIANELYVSPLFSQAIPQVSLLKTSIGHQTRCVPGTFGQKCTLKTNHFVVSLPGFQVYKYEVCIFPEVTSCGVNRAVMEELVSVYRQSDLNGCLPAYDGRKHIYTAAQLPFTFRTFVVKLQSDGQAQRSPMRLRQFMVTIKFMAHVDMSLNVGQDGHQLVLQVLDIILQEIFIRRSCPIAESLQLGEGLEVHQFFYKRLQSTRMGILLNTDVLSRVLMKPMPVIRYIALLLDKDTLTGPLCDGDLTKIKKALEGVMVQVIVMNKSYRVIGLSERAIRELTAYHGDHGAMKPFVHYFEEKYGYDIQHTDLPCLEVGTKHMPILVPMEVCKIADGQRYSKQLNRKQMSSRLEAARLHPVERKYYILQTVEQHKENSYAKEFGIEVKEQLLSLDARVLPPPWLKFHGNGMTEEFLPRAGRWNMIRKRMYNGGRVSNWTCVNFSWDVEDEIVISFCHELVVVCQASGMEFMPDPVLPVVSADPKDVERTLKSFHEAMNMLEPQGRELDLLIVILPSNKGSFYGNLKRICETELGLVSQCCLAKYVSQRSKQYLANVALKINVKVGGRNTVLSDALKRRLPGVGNTPTIIFGAHVMHPRTSNSPSISAVVASQDWPEIATYAALASAQANGQELILDPFEASHVCETGATASGMISDHLIAFMRRTGLKPERIIYYRDAVSNGQLYRVMGQELVAIKKACSYLEPNYNPPVTYVVLQKHRHTRFFADKHNESFESRGNVLPGTVVDYICHPNEFGFYLCSQIGTKGTILPVHYQILWDENRFTADTFQCLTNYLSYTYAKCTHSVSIVPPVYYARLMAWRGRLYMETTTSKIGDEGHAPSPSEESSSGALRSVVRLPAVKDNMKHVMFYC